MIGLSYLLAGCVYLWLTVLLVRFAWNRGSRAGSPVRGGIYAAVVMLVAYHAIFWDAVPVTLLRDHYCSSDAGLQASESAQAWIQRNSARLDDFRISRGERMSMHSSNDESGWQVSTLNRVLVWKNRRTLVAPSVLNIYCIEDEIIDIRDGSRLMRLKDYEAGRQLVTDTIRPQPYFPSCASNKRDQFIGVLGLLERLGNGM
jgi:hypothetical protein